MKSAEEIMQMLDAYDLIGSFVTPASSPGARFTPVARYVALQEAGGISDRRRRGRS